MISPRAAFPLALLGVTMLSAAAPVDHMPLTAASILDGDSSTSGIPLMRWWSALTLYSNYSGTDGVFAGVNAQTASFMFYTGSLPWFIAMLLFGLGNGNSLLDYAGAWIDDTMSAVLGVFFAPGRDGLSPIGLLVVAAIITSVALSLRRARGMGAGEIAKRLVSFAVLSALLFFSVGQLNANTSERDVSGGGYDPNFGTPGWVVVTVQDAISRITNIPASVVQLGAGQTAPDESADASVLSCQAFIPAMQEAAEVDGTVEGAISSMWLTAATSTYSAVQFSDSSTLGNDVMCRMLDRQAGAATGSSYSIDEQLLIDAGLLRTGRTPNVADGLKPTATGSNLFRYSLTTTNGQWSAAMTGWAFCDRTSEGWVFDARYDGYGDAEPLEEMNEQCGNLMEAFINNEGEIIGPDGETVDLGVFQVDTGSIGDRVDQIQNDQARTEAEQFLRGLTGQNPNVGSAFLFASTAILGALPIIIVGLAILLLSLTVMAFLIAAYGALIAALFSSQPWSRVVWPPLARLLGAALITGAAGLIMGIIALFATAVATMFSAGTGSTGSAVAVIGSGLAPGIAVLGLHVMMRKLRVPSPLSIRGARAWAKGAPFIAGAAASMVGSQVGGALARAGKSAAGKAIDTGGRQLGRMALNKVGLGSLGDTLLGASPGRGRMGGGVRSGTTDLVNTGTKVALESQQKVSSTVADDGVKQFESPKAEARAAATEARAIARSERAAAKSLRAEQKALDRASQKQAIRERADAWIAKRQHGRGEGFDRTVVTRLRANLAARNEINREQLANEWSTAKQTMAENVRRTRSKADDLASMVADTETRQRLFTGAGHGMRDATRAARDGVADTVGTAAAGTGTYMRHVMKDPKAYVGAALTATGIGAPVGLPLMAAASVQAGKTMSRERRATVEAQIQAFRQRQQDSNRSETASASMPQSDSHHETRG